MNNLILNQMKAELPDEPPMKKFKSKHNLPLLDDYKQNPNKHYWNYWPKLTWEEGKNIKVK